MTGLDMRTVMVSHVITDILGLIVIFFLWRQNRGRYQGLAKWMAGYGLQALGTVFIIARGAVPVWLSVILGNTFIVAGISTTIDGIHRFAGRSRTRIPEFALWGLLAASLFGFSVLRPDLQARTIAVTAAMGILFVAGAEAGFRRAASESRRISSRVGIAFALLALFSFARIIAVAVQPPRNQDFFKAGIFEVLFLLAYQTLFIFMTYNFALMVNERLLGEIGYQEEKFEKAFHISPYGISLTDVETGRLIDLNDGFIDLLGFSREDALGRTTIELNVWEKEEDRRRAMSELASRGKIRNRECRFRKKSGEMIIGLWSAETIVINGRPCVFSSITDITPRKRAEDGLRHSVRQKDLLMRELKNRVKNSLTVVSGFLGLSRETAADPRIKALLSDLRSRIGSVSSLYEQLDWTGQVDRIRLKPYIRKLADSLALSYGPTDERIRIATNLADLELETRKALPLGLIINELIINGFKYAYPDGRSGEIRIELKEADSKTALSVSDDGIGKKAGLVLAGGEGSGGALIETLAGQIGAEVRSFSGPGTRVEIVF